MFTNVSSCEIFCTRAMTESALSLEYIFFRKPPAHLALNRLVPSPNGTPDDALRTQNR
jgi:hypothetical protein